MKISQAFGIFFCSAFQEQQPGKLWVGWYNQMNGGWPFAIVGIILLLIGAIITYFGFKKK